MSRSRSNTESDTANSASSRSAPADEVNDFDDVALFELGRLMACSWNDLPIAFYRDRPCREAQVLDETLNGDSAGHVVSFTVDSEFHRSRPNYFLDPAQAPGAQPPGAQPFWASPDALGVGPGTSLAST